MKSTVSVLTTPTVDTRGTSVVLNLEDKSYIFGNAHEGFQRTCISNGVRMVKLNDIFLTGTTEWRTTGGIMGFILTVADVMQGAVDATTEMIRDAQERWEQRLKKAPNDKERERLANSAQPKDKLASIEKPRLSIHGGDNVMQLLATARRFIFRKGLPLSVHEYGDSTSNAAPTWSDHNIEVWAMPLRPQNNTPQSSFSPTQKRSFDEFAEPFLVSDNASNDSVSDRKKKLRGVISDMFDSDWRMDALFETPLAEVQLPAKMFVRNPETKSFEVYQGPMPDSGEDISGIKVLVRKAWPGALIANLPDTHPSSTSMSYIVKNRPRRGKFDPNMAKELGIPKGPDYRKLANGESVQNAKGETITPDQVSGPLRNGRGFAVIEILTADYIPSLRESFAYNNREIMEDIEAIFWLLGPGITKDAAFQALIQEQPTYKHIISSPDHCANHLTIDRAAAAQLKHRAIDKDRYSIPIHNNELTAFAPELSSCVIAQRGVTVTLEPELKFDTEMDPPLLNTIEEVRTTPKKATQLGEEAQKKITSSAFQQEYENQNLVGGDTEIITLGTGSAAPSKQRNVSATLVRVPNVGSYLLDTGENTMGQLSRLYSSKELEKVLRDLKLIWISHMHADHHLGLASVIKAWHTAVHGDPSKYNPPNVRLLDQISNPAKYLIDQQKLCIVAEGEMLHWLQEYSEIENFGYDMVLPLHVNPSQFDQANKTCTPTALYWHKQSVGFNVSSSTIKAAISQATGLSNLQAVHVSHCRGARAVAMSWPNGLKISYSGDCRPSYRFAKIGTDSTVLIHEATFDDALAGDAKAKKHTTTREAIAVGIKMRAKRIILTHFSQRYSKLPELKNVVAQSVDFEDAETAATTSTANVDSHAPVDGQGEDEGGNADKPTSAETQSSEVQNQAAIDSEAAKDIKIGVAFDLMRVKIKDIIALDNFKAAFMHLYDEVDPAKLVRKAEAEAEAIKRVEEKKAKQENRRQQQMAEAALRRKSSRSSIASANASVASTPVSSSMAQVSTETAGSKDQVNASNGL